MFSLYLKIILGRIMSKEILKKDINEFGMSSCESNLFPNDA